MQAFFRKDISPQHNCHTKTSVQRKHFCKLQRICTVDCYVLDSCVSIITDPKWLFKFWWYYVLIASLGVRNAVSFIFPPLLNFQGYLYLIFQNTKNISTKDLPIEVIPKVNKSVTAQPFFGLWWNFETFSLGGLTYHHSQSTFGTCKQSTHLSNLSL